LEGVHIREFIILVDFRIHFHVTSYGNGTISVLDDEINTNSPRYCNIEE